jgi:hypothetical protein
MAASLRDEGLVARGRDPPNDLSSSSCGGRRLLRRKSANRAKMTRRASAETIVATIITVVLLISPPISPPPAAGLPEEPEGVGDMSTGAAVELEANVLELGAAVEVSKEVGVVDVGGGGTVDEIKGVVSRADAVIGVTVFGKEDTGRQLRFCFDIRLTYARCRLSHGYENCNVRHQSRRNGRRCCSRGRHGNDRQARRH